MNAPAPMLGSGWKELRHRSMRPWARDFTSLSLTFLNCKMKGRGVSAQGWCNDKIKRETTDIIRRQTAKYAQYVVASRFVFLALWTRSLSHPLRDV